MFWAVGFLSVMPVPGYAFHITEKGAKPVNGAWPHLPPAGCSFSPISSQDPEVLRREYYLLGRCLYEQGWTGQGAQAFRAAANWSREMGNDTLLGKAYYQASRCLYDSLGFTDTTRLVLEQTLEYVKRVGDAERSFNTLSRLIRGLNQSGTDSLALKDYMAQLLGQAVMVNDEGKLAKAYHFLGVTAYYQGRLNESATYYQVAGEEYLVLGDSANWALLQKDFAFTYADMGDYKEAKHLLQLAYKFFVKEENIKEALTVQAEVARQLLLEGDTTEAGIVLLDLYHRYDTLEEYTGRAHVLNQMGLVLMGQGRLDSAIVAFSTAVSHFERDEDARNSARANLNLALCYEPLGLTEQADSCFRLSVEQATRLESDPIKASVYLDWASVLYERGDKEPALVKATKGLFWAKWLKVHDMQLFGNLLLGTLYKELDRPDSEAMAKAFSLSYDSLQQLSDQQSHNRFNHYKPNVVPLYGRRYTQSMNQLAGQLSEAEADGQRNLNYLSWSAALAVSLLFATGLLFRVYRSQREKAQLMALLYNEERHRIKNNLHLLYSIFSLRSRKIENPQERQLLLEGKSKVEVLMTLHAEMQHVDGKEKAVYLPAYIEELISRLQETFEGSKIKVKYAIVNAQLDARRTVSLGLLLNELMTNTIKYAFTEHPAPLLSIAVEAEGADFKLVFQDNGPGFATSDEVSSGFGLSFCRRIAEAGLKGTFTISGEAGTRVTITFPKIG